ncbi:MAG: glycosyltransferase family 39 protein [bacterium]|nr:glycosyltransferase family 39 protein [bacterium]
MSIFISIISAVIIFGSGIILIWHMLANAGVKLSYTIPDKSARYFERHTPSSRECVTAFICSMLFRIFVIAAAYVGFCIFSGSGNFKLTEIYSRWLQWDANNYIRISEGYKSFDINGDYSTIVFFPLYSWLLRIVRIFIHQPVIAGLTLSALLSSASCVYLYKLVCIDYSRNTAQNAAVLMCIFPFSFFFGSVMSESAFLLTSIMTLYYTRKHNWIMAGISGILAALSRSAGVFLIFPATVEFIEEYKLFELIKKPKELFNLVLRKWTWLLLLPLGTIIYLIINYWLSGDPFYFFDMEEKYWHQVSQPFFKTAGSLFEIAFTGSKDTSTKMSAFLPGFVSLMCSYALLVFGLRRHRSMYMFWLVIYIVINTTMSWPLSLCRYISAAVPIYIILADMCERSKKLNTALLLSWGILYGIYLTGYVTTHQLM